MNISIIGASGFVGFFHYKYIKEKFKKDKVYGTYLSNKTHPGLKKVDINNINFLDRFIKLTNPDTILWFAGIKNTNLCEDDHDLALRLNVRPIRHVVGFLEDIKFQGRFFYYSSDHVFSGKKGSYKENSFRKPRTYYGETKYLAEKVLEESKIDYLIIRTSNVTGLKSTFIRWLVNELSQKGECYLYNNAIFSPTPLLLLLEATAFFIKNPQAFRYRRLHVVGDLSVSRYEFGLKVIKILQLDGKIIPIAFDKDKVLIANNSSLKPSKILCQIQSRTFSQYLKASLIM
ncbi:SDR family oxidoreductase [Patescibacteria group bacterium]